MRRVFALASALCEAHPATCVPLEPFDAFLARVGLWQPVDETLTITGEDTKTASPGSGG
jgi:hypothetical protein